MTRYANLKRNADIVALFELGIPPKRIPVELRERYPEITLKIVYKLTERRARARFHAERIGEIRGNASIAKGESTA